MSAVSNEGANHPTVPHVKDLIQAVKQKQRLPVRLTGPGLVLSVTSAIPATGFSWYSLFEMVLARHSSLYFLVSVAIVCWL